MAPFEGATFLLDEVLKKPVRILLIIALIAAGVFLKAYLEEKGKMAASQTSQGSDEGAKKSPASAPSVDGDGATPPAIDPQTQGYQAKPIPPAPVVHGGGGNSGQKLAPAK